MSSPMAEKAKAFLAQHTLPGGQLNDTAPAELADKMSNINEYKNATAPTAPVAHPLRFSAPADLIHPAGQYGTQPGEQRIDVSSFQKPLVSQGGFSKVGK